MSTVQLPFDHPALRLHLLPHEYFVAQTPASTEDWTRLVSRLAANPAPGAGIAGPRFLSFTRTDEEISIVGECSPDSDYKTGEWRCIKIAGPMEFSLSGIMNAFSDPLRRAGVPIFAVSTYNTDYVLVRKEKVDVAVKALKDDGWLFNEE